MRHRFLVTCAVALLHFVNGDLAHAQEVVDSCDYPKMELSGRKVPKLTLRKTTDGTSKDEAKPASFGYENPDTGNDYLLIDAALKWDVLECRFGTFQMILSPAVEVHRSEFESNPVKKTTAKIEAEMWWGLLQFADGSGEGSSWLPYPKFEYGQTRDSIKQKNSSKSALMVHFDSARPLRPSGWVKWKCDAVVCPNRFRWTPSFGVEYYDSLPVERTGLPTIESINSTVGVGRIGIEYWPFLLGRGTENVVSRLQILVEYTGRWHIGGDPLPEGSANLLTAGVTYYLDSAQTIGIGIEREDGESPVRNFRDEERTTVSLRAKF